MDEDDHALEYVAGFGEIWRVPCVSLGVDIFQGDLAAGLSVIRDEALGLVSREAGIRVLVVVQHVAAALEPDRRRSFDSLPTLECEHGVNADGLKGLCACQLAASPSAGRGGRRRRSQHRRCRNRAKYTTYEPSKRCGSSSRSMESGMPDCGFGRCDGHHKMIDFRLEKSSGLGLLHQRLFTRRVGAQCLI